MAIERSARYASELALVGDVARGDEGAIAGLYRTHADVVFRFVHRRVEERYEDAQEITHDTFLSAFSLASTYDGSCAIRTWLCGIAKIHIVGYYRKQGRQKRIPANRIVSEAEGLEATGAPGAESDAVAEAVHRLGAVQLVEVMMDCLTDDEREALLLRYVDEFSIQEIARLLKRTEKAVEHSIARARKQAAIVGEQWMAQTSSVGEGT